MNGRLVNLGAGQQGRTFAISSARAGQADALRTPKAKTDKSEKSKSDSAAHEPDLLTRVFRALDQSLPLPNNARAYSYFLLALLVVAGGMMVQLVLSANILESRVELADKQNRHTIIERDNAEILWQIGRETNFRNIQTRAMKAGYVSIENREYIDANGHVVSDEPAPSNLRNMLKERAESETAAAEGNADSATGADADEVLDGTVRSEYTAMRAETTDSRDNITALLAIMFVEQLEEWAGALGNEIDTVTDSMTDTVSRSVGDSVEFEELSRNANNWQSERLGQPIQHAVEWVEGWIDGVLER